MKPNPQLLGLNRSPEDTRGRDRFVRLDRNERVVPFSKEEFSAMLSILRPEMFSAYPDTSPLLDRLSAQMRLPQEWLRLTNGSDAAIRKLFQTFVGPADTVLLAEPSYAMYPIYAQIFGGVVDAVSYRADRTLDVREFLSRLRRHPKAVVIANPDQPTGASLPLEDIRAIATEAHTQDTLCVIDEAYYPFHPVTAIDLVRDFENIVVTRTFSKVGGLAGLRLGYLVAQPEITGHIDRVRGAHEVNVVAVQMGCFMLDHPELGDRYVKEVEGGRSVLIEGARRTGLTCPPSPANFQLVELPRPLDPVAVADALKGRGYLVKAGFDHRSVERCFRVTLAGPDVMQSFVAALRDICAPISV